MKAVKRSLLLLLCVAMLVAGALVMSACSKECTHEWGDWSVTTAATCIAEGTETRACNKCDETETRAIAKTAHTFSTYVPDGNATCLADGTKTATCTTSGCTAKDTVADAGSKKAHTFTNYTSNNDATCQADGTKTASCDTDGCTATETVTDTGSKKSHSFTTYQSDGNATCQADGTKTAVCDYYGCTQTDTVTDTGSKKSHSFTSYVPNEDATCVLDGTKIATCDFTGCSETDTIEDEGSKLGHLWDAELTCETGHSCTRENCDAEEAALGHDYRVIGGTELTCEQDSTTVYACHNGCGDDFTVTNELAKGHSVEEWKLDGEQFIGECTYELTYVGTCTNPGCGQNVTKTETTERHTLKSTIHTDATCKTPGQKLITCSGCSYEAYEEYTNTEAHVWTVKSTEGNVTTYECSECQATKTAITATENTETTVDKSTLESVGEVELKDASIALDSDTLGGLDGDVSISAGTLEGTDLDAVMGTLDGDKIAQIGDNPIYNFGLTDANGTVSNFNGWVTIRVPYTLEDGDDVDSIAIWFINDNGEVESIEAVYDNGYAVFSTNHFSYYTVTRLTPAERCALYDHTYKVTAVDATCVSDGYVLKVCQRCGNSSKEITGKATGHIITTTTVNANCTESGTATHACDVCDYERVEKIAPLGHAWAAADSAEATCKSAGYTVYECSKCDATYKTVIAQKAHSYKDTVTKATCTADGYTTRVCEWCQYTVTTNKIAALGHDYKTTTVASSCTTEGYTLNDCSRCDASYKTDIVPPSHTWDIEAATCGKGQTCIVCGASGQSATGNHTMANGVCSVCGVGCNHTYNSVVTAPTCTEVGYTTNTCTVCGVVEKTDYKSATGHSGALTCTVCGASIVPADYYTNIFDSLLNEKYTILIDSMQVSDGMYIVDSEIYVTIKDGLSGWGTVNIKAYGTIATFRAIIEDEIVYLCGENTTALTQSKDVYAKIPLAELMAEAGMDTAWAMIASLAMNEDVLNWVNDTLLPFLTNLTKDAEDEASLIAKKVVELIADVNEVDGDLVITVSAEKLKALNARLATETIGELIDTEFGAGTYDDIVEAVEKLFATTIGEIIDDAKANGADVIALVDSVDALIAKMMGGNYTLSDLMELDTTIQEMLKDEELRAMTVEDIVAMLAEGFGGSNVPNDGMKPEQGVTDKVENSATPTSETNESEEISIKDQIIEALTQLKDVTVYQLAGVEADVDNVIEAVDGVIDETLAELSVAIVTDKNGTLLSVNLAYADYCDISIVADYTSTIDYSEVKANAEANTGFTADENYISGTYNNGQYEFEIDEDGKLIAVWYTNSYKDTNIMQSETDDNGNRTEIVVVYARNYEYYADLTNALIATHSDCKNWFGVAIMAPGTCTYTSKTYIEIRTNGEVTEIIDDPEMLEMVLEMLGIGSKDESYTESEMVEVEFFIDSVTGEITSFNNAYTLHDYEEDEAKHVPAVGCEGAGEYHYFCTECGETLVVPYVNGHDYEWSYELKEGATSCEEGLIATRFCTVCGKVSNSYETDYHETEWEELDFSGYGVCEHHYFQKYSCACGQEGGFSYGNGFEWNDGGAYCPECGVTVTEDATYTPGEGCTMNVVRVIVITVNGTTIYSDTVNRTYEEHDMRDTVTLMPGSTTCEDGILVKQTCSKCGESWEEYEEYYHREYEKVLVDFADYGSTCGGYIYTYCCACGYYGDKSWISVSSDCKFDETDVYYNDWRDYCYKYTCAVTSPACGFTYYERNRLVENQCGYTVYREYYVIENGNEVMLYSYVYEENVYHNYESSSENKTPVTEFPCLYLVSRVEACMDCGHENVFEGYEFQHSYNDHDDGWYCDTCDAGSHYEYDDQYRTISLIEIYWYISGDNIQKNYEERRWMYYMDYQFITREYTSYEYYYNRDGKWQLEDPYWYSNTFEYDFSGKCTVTRTYEDSYGSDNYSNTYCACQYFTYGSATDATCTQYGVGTKTCLVCGTSSSYEIEPICHEWIWYDEGGCYACVYCGLKNANGASGEIVLEDASDIDDDEDTYIVGYFYRMGDKFEIIYAITLITADGEEIYIDLDAYGIAITPWGNGNYITFSKSAVMDAAAKLGYTEDQYDIRISFVPVGWETDLDYAITFEVMSATDECTHYYYKDTCIFCGESYKEGGNVEDGNCRHYYENGNCIYCGMPEDYYEGGDIIVGVIPLYYYQQSSEEFDGNGEVAMILTMCFSLFEDGSAKYNVIVYDVFGDITTIVEEANGEWKETKSDEYGPYIWAIFNFEDEPAELMFLFDENGDIYPNM